MDESFPSLFLTQAIGLYLVIGAVVMLARASYYREVLAQLKADNIIVPFAAGIGLMGAIILILLHNIWVLNLAVVLTVFAWFLLLKSVLWLLVPECMLSYSQKIYASCWYYVFAVLGGLIGILMLAHLYYLI